jgi:hypothetical protein
LLVPAALSETSAKLVRYMTDMENDAIKVASIHKKVKMKGKYESKVGK